MKELLALFLTFTKIGAFMFGGGYSMLPLLNRELVDRRGWSTEEELLDYFAIAQGTPGIIAVNTATFVGHKRKGVLGAIAATLGVVFIPIVLIGLIATILRPYWDAPIVIRAFTGIRVAVSALIVSAVIRLVKTSVKDWVGIALCIISFVLIAFLHQSPVFIVLGAALFGIVYGRVRA